MATKRVERKCKVTWGENMGLFGTQAAFVMKDKVNLLLVNLVTNFFLTFKN
jgi:hypothetical protein